MSLSVHSTLSVTPALSGMLCFAVPCHALLGSAILGQIFKTHEAHSGGLHLANPIAARPGACCCAVDGTPVDVCDMLDAASFGWYP